MQLQNLALHGLLKIGIQRFQVGVQRAELSRGLVEVRSEIAELVAVWDLDTLLEISGGDPLDSFDESMLADVDENDPRSVARFARRMRDEMGDELGPDFDQAIEQMEAGEMPDDLGDGDGGDDLFPED